MDEFHYYGDPDRGLGVAGAAAAPAARAVHPHVGDARRRRRRSPKTSSVARAAPRRPSRASSGPCRCTSPTPRRPSTRPSKSCCRRTRRPIYIVHFSQAAAMERAQALSSIRIVTREQRDAIAEAIGGFRFTTAFGRPCRATCGPASACTTPGCCPRYRRLVETLAQRGLLRVICGTDTLGVGINVPIRTVLITALAKFDGHADAAAQRPRVPPDRGPRRARRVRHRGHRRRHGARARDRERRRGRQGGRRPEEAQEDRPQEGAGGLRQLGRGDVRAARRRRARAARAAAAADRGDAHQRHRARRRRVRERPRRSCFDNHEPRARQFELARRALAIFRTLRDRRASCTLRPDASGTASIRLTVDLQPNFALNQPLSPFALAAIELLDPTTQPGDRRSHRAATTRSTSSASSRRRSTTRGPSCRSSSSSRAARPSPR